MVNGHLRDPAVVNTTYRCRSFRFKYKSNLSKVITRIECSNLSLLPVRLVWVGYQNIGSSLSGQNVEPVGIGTFGDYVLLWFCELAGYSTIDIFSYFFINLEYFVILK